jgi:hypothetical protein
MGKSDLRIPFVSFRAHMKVSWNTPLTAWISSVSQVMPQQHGLCSLPRNKPQHQNTAHVQEWRWMHMHYMKVLWAFLKVMSLLLCDSGQEEWLYRETRVRKASREVMFSDLRAWCSFWNLSKWLAHPVRARWTSPSTHSQQALLLETLLKKKKLKLLLLS